MGKRLKDADSRRFLDEFEKVRVSRFRASGVIDPARHEALIPFPNGKIKLIGTKHTWFAKGGGWSYFVCPGCARRTTVLYLLDDAPRCQRCCAAMNIKHRRLYGFGRAERRRASDKTLDQTIAKIEATTPLRLKPAPVSWRGAAQIAYNSQRLTNAVRQGMVSLRLSQIAADWAKQGDQIKITLPIAAAQQLVDLRSIQRARTSEQLEQALDKAQAIIIAAVSSPDPKQSLNAIKLMLRTKQARDRGW